MENKMRLNFFPLSDQSFKFKVWRKEGASHDGGKASDDLYLNSLPVDNISQARKTYWISFASRDGFEEFSCTANYNNRLAQHYLFKLLVEKSKSVLSEEEFFLPKSPFKKNVFFVLKKHPQGKEVVWLEPYYLNPSRKLGFLADFKFSKEPEVLFSKDVQRLSLSLDDNFRSNRNFYIDRYQRISDFLKRYKDRIFPLGSDGGSGIDIAASLEPVEIKSLESKQYVFSGGKTDTVQYRGVATHGPLQGIQQPVILIFVYRSSERSLADDLKKALRGQVPGVTFGGMERVFGFKFSEQDIILDNLSETELADCAEKIQEVKHSEKGSAVLPVMVLDKEDTVAYPFMKYELLRRNIPLQVVTPQLVRRRDGLKWSTSNIALQIFVKLGGRPWGVQPSRGKSIIFGIGQSHEIKDGSIQKYFAYSVCTDSSGIYKKVDILGKSGDLSNYLQELKRNIVNAVEENMSEGYASCVLHIPFKMKKNELMAINEAVQEIVNAGRHPDVTFVVLKVNVENKFFGYAYTNSLVPYEGTFMQLTHNPDESYLVWFEGLQLGKEAILKRISGPIHVEFYWTSRKLEQGETMAHLQDLLNLSGSNWSGFSANNRPISIYYCELIAKFLKRFPGDVDTIGASTSPWFV